MSAELMSLQNSGALNLELHVDRQHDGPIALSL